MKSALLLFEPPRLAVAGSVVQILPGRKAGGNKIDQIIIIIEDDFPKVNIIQFSVRCSISDTW